MKKIKWRTHLIELVVVFLGITAGFILQNKKEQNAGKELEQKYTEGIQTDVLKNIESLKEFIQSDSLWLAESKYALRLIAVDSLNQDSANALIKTMVSYSEFDEQITTYENIINSGNLNLIEDYDLKQKIVDYHKELENFKLLEIYFREYFTGTFMPFIMVNFNLFKEKLTVPESHKSVLFKNLFGTHYSLTQQRHKAYNNLLVESKEMAKLLNDKLNN